MKKILASLSVSVSLFALSAFLYVIDFWNESWSSKPLALTFLVLGTTHFIFRVVIYYVLVHHIKHGKVRYNLSKTLTLIHLFIASLFILRIWLPDSTALLAAYGFVAAAVAFSVQDLFKNLFGGILIIIRSLYRVGDRIQIGETQGDIIDIGILYTTLLEIRAWVAGDQSTGRIILVPNGKVINTDVVNYTADHSFIWDEIHVPVTHDSDWKKADKILNEIIIETTNELSTSALEEIKHLQSKYFLTNDNVEPRVYMVLTDNWISLYGRYIVSVRERRNVQDQIMRTLKDRLDKEKKIFIASTTSSITINE